MKPQIRLDALSVLSILCIVVLGAPGCGSDSDAGMFSAPSPVTLQAGDPIPLGTTVRISIDAAYPIARGGNALTTVCNGYVEVVLDYGKGPEINSCESHDGSANQTNAVSGLDSVTYRFGTDAFADVTLN